MPLEGDLITLVQGNPNGIDAASLRTQLEARGYAAAEVREAIRYLLDRGVLRLGRDLRFEAEAA